MTDAELVRHLVLLATRAPSLHNSQPWRVVVSGDGLDVVADRERQLPVLDPTGRQLLVSCGALVHHLVVAARALGLQAGVTLLPGSSPDLVAHLRLIPTSVPPAPADVGHAEAILHRATRRTRYAEASVSPRDLELLRQAVAAQGAALVRVREEHQADLDALVGRAERELLADEAYRHELEDWVFDPERDGERVDGMPRAAVDPGTGRAEEVPGRTFVPGGAAGGADADGAPPSAEHPTLLLLTTLGDEPEDWVRAGMALSAVLLEATGAGLAAQPIGQVTDVPHERARLRTDLRLVGVPQLLLRVGPARVEAGLLTPRRPVDGVLSWAATTG